eukprot:1141479-Pelagomonas_calceolata.AAC.4
MHTHLHPSSATHAPAQKQTTQEYRWWCPRWPHAACPQTQTSSGLQRKQQQPVGLGCSGGVQVCEGKQVCVEAVKAAAAAAAAAAACGGVMQMCCAHAWMQAGVVCRRVDAAAAAAACEVCGNAHNWKTA